MHNEIPSRKIEQLANMAASDPPARDELCELIRPWVVKFLTHRSLQPADVDNVAQEVMLKINGALHSFEYRGEGSFFAWLKTITERALITYRQREERHPGSLPRERLEQTAPLDFAVHNLELLDELERRTQGWTPNQLEYISVFRGQISHQQFCENQNLPKGSAAHVRRFVRKKLAEILGNQQDRRAEQ